MNKTKIKELPITELFKQFCKERHAEDKGRNYDTLQEIYAKTELFDLSFLERDIPDLSKYIKKGEENKLGQEIISLDLEKFTELSLPFDNQYIKVGVIGASEVGEGFPNTCVFLREYSPFTITGTVWLQEPTRSINVPFTIHTENGNLVIDTKGIRQFVTYLVKFRHMHIFEARSTIEELIAVTLQIIDLGISNICNLPNHSVATDTPKHAEYFTRKHGSTIKVVKPIYYVMNKKEETEKRNYNRIKPLGHLAFDHSFKVRGHWRKINPHTYGKNRQGEYVVTGITWVKEHTKGEGDLIKKIRVVK